MKKQETKYKRGQHPNSKANLEKVDNTSEEVNANKSNGHIQKRAEVNVLLNAETLFDNKNILPQLIENIKQQVDLGNNKDAIDLMKLFKKNDNSTNINVQGVQKIFVTQEELQEVDKHIDNIIGE